MHKTSINGADVPPGALVSFIQKGLQYLELEANLTEVRGRRVRFGRRASAERRAPGWPQQDGTEVDAGFSLLTAHDLLSKDVDELKTLVTQRRELVAKRDKERPRPAAPAPERPADGRVKTERRAEDKSEPGAPSRHATHLRSPELRNSSLLIPPLTHTHHSPRSQSPWRLTSRPPRPRSAPVTSPC